MLNRIIRKFNSALFYGQQWHLRTMAQLRQRWAQLYVSAYKWSGATVFIGPYFASLGGVSHHLQSLNTFSKQRTATLPSDRLLKFLLKHQLLPYYKSVVEQHLFGRRIMHSHVDPWFIELCEKAQQQGSPWVHTYHTLYFKKDWNQGLEDWQININTALIEKAKQADVKIAIAHWLKNHLKQHYDIETVYVPNGVDVAKCDRANAARFKTKHGLEDFILFASGISDIKNAGIFLRLAQALPAYPFVIIGRGITKKGLEAKFQVPLGANITVFGAMPHEDLLDAIAACKVFVVTSKSEGLPTVLMEAMALERSVVGVNTFGTKEVIHSDDYGYLYEADNLDDLIAKTQQAYQHSKGSQARQRILEAYDWRVVIPKIDKIYQDLLHEEA